MDLFPVSTPQPVRANTPSKKQRAVTGHFELFMSVVLYKFDIISTSDKRCIRGTDSRELKVMSNGESRRREWRVESGELSGID